MRAMSEGRDVDQPTMPALAAHAGRPDSLHARRVRRPTLDEVAGGRGVPVRVLRVGVGGTDREIIVAKFGQLFEDHAAIKVFVEVSPPDIRTR